MNITIILPAVQVVKRDSSSPQPTTTPFPPVSVTSSCPHSPCTTSEYQEILEQYHRHVKQDEELSQSRVDLIAARQVAYDYANEDFETPCFSPTKSIDLDEIGESEEFQRISSSQITTDSPSSQDTVKTVIRSPPKVVASESNNTLHDKKTSEVYIENDTRDKAPRESLTLTRSLHETDHETENLHEESALLQHQDAAVIENNQRIQNSEQNNEAIEDIINLHSNNQILEEVEELIIIREEKNGQPHILITTQGSNHTDYESDMEVRRGSQNTKGESWEKSDSIFSDEEVPTHTTLPDKENGHNHNHKSEQRSTAESYPKIHQGDEAASAYVGDKQDKVTTSRPVLRRQSRQNFSPDTQKTDSKGEEDLRTSDEKSQKKSEKTSSSRRGSELGQMSQQRQVIQKQDSISHGVHEKKIVASTSSSRRGSQMEQITDKQAIRSISHRVSETNNVTSPQKRKLSRQPTEENVEDYPDPKLGIINNTSGDEQQRVTQENNQTMEKRSSISIIPREKAYKDDETLNGRSSRQDSKCEIESKSTKHSPEQQRVRQSPPTKHSSQQHQSQTHQSPPSKHSPEKEQQLVHQSSPTEHFSEQQLPRQSPPSKHSPEQQQRASQSPPTKISQEIQRVHQSPPAEYSSEQQQPEHKSKFIQRSSEQEQLSHQSPPSKHSPEQQQTDHQSPFTKYSSEEQQQHEHQSPPKKHSPEQPQMADQSPLIQRSSEQQQLSHQSPPSKHSPEQQQTAHQSPPTKYSSEEQQQHEHQSSHTKHSPEQQQRADQSPLIPRSSEQQQLSHQSPPSKYSPEQQQTTHQSPFTKYSHEDQQQHEHQSPFRKHSSEQQQKAHQSPPSREEQQQHEHQSPPIQRSSEQQQLLHRSPPLKHSPEQQQRAHQSPPTKYPPEKQQQQAQQSPPSKHSTEQQQHEHQSPPRKHSPEKQQQQTQQSPPSKHSTEQQQHEHSSQQQQRAYVSPTKKLSQSELNTTPKEKQNNSGKSKPSDAHHRAKQPAYPYRVTKTTIARQALAREKRRAYVEERIQRCMESSHYTSTNALHESYIMTNGHGPIHEEDIADYGAEDLHAIHEKEQGRRFTKLDTTSMSSLPDINSYHHYSSYAASSSRRVPFSYHTESVPPPQTISAISIIKPPPPFSTPLQSNTASHTAINTSEINTTTQSNTSFHSESSHNSGIYVDSNPEATSNFWKNVSEQGFYYSFRVRQSGTVQMIDKSVQTGEQPQSYILDFSRKPDGRYYLQNSRPLNLGHNDTHLPPINRDKILRDIAETVQLRHDGELRRAELIQRANELQSLVKEKREKINRRHEFWHKKYIEESSMTRPLEAACTSLRSELNTVHRRLIAHLEGRDLPLRLRDGPSKKANYKIMAARLQHEIKELQQKAKAAKLRLESEVKLKEQAEREVRDIRNDLAHKKVVMSMARSQFPPTLAHHPRAYEALVY